jgi:hypothetical protein
LPSFVSLGPPDRVLCCTPTILQGYIDKKKGSNNCGNLSEIFSAVRNLNIFSTCVTMPCGRATPYGRFTGGLPVGQVACGHLQLLWTPYAYALNHSHHLSFKRDWICFPFPFCFPCQKKMIHLEKLWFYGSLDLFLMRLMTANDSRFEHRRSAA